MTSLISTNKQTTLAVIGLYSKHHEAKLKQQTADSPVRTRWSILYIAGISRSEIERCKRKIIIIKKKKFNCSTVTKKNPQQFPTISLKCFTQKKQL